MRMFASGIFLILSAAPALAVQDTPTTINGIETVCTGVGSAKDDPRWSAYPLKIVVANSAGQNLAAMQFSLTMNGKPVVQTVCDAPWVLFKLPAGRYAATATMTTPPGLSRTSDFTVGGSGQKEVDISFGAMPPDK